jgi:hypothetical protein
MGASSRRGPCNQELRLAATGWHGARYIPFPLSGTIATARASCPQPDCGETPALQAGLDAKQMPVPGLRITAGHGLCDPGDRLLLPENLVTLHSCGAVT